MLVKKLMLKTLFIKTSGECARIPSLIGKRCKYKVSAFITRVKTSKRMKQTRALGGIFCLWGIGLPFAIFCDVNRWNWSTFVVMKTGSDHRGQGAGFGQLQTVGGLPI